MRINDLDTTINGPKEEGRIHDHRTPRGDPPAEAWEYQWNGYPLPVGVRLTDVKKRSEK